jgi:hypothetical protein
LQLRNDAEGDHTSHQIETLTIRIPMRLQRRGG